MQKKTKKIQEKEVTIKRQYDRLKDVIDRLVRLQSTSAFQGGNASEAAESRMEEEEPTSKKTRKNKDKVSQS